MIDISEPGKPSQPQRAKVQGYVLGVILILLFFGVCRLFAPFFTVFLWSVLFYVILSPLHRLVVKKLDFNTRQGKILRSLWAAVFALGTAILILMPLFFLAIRFVHQIIELARKIADTLNSRPAMFHDAFGAVSDWVRDFSLGQVEISPDQIRVQIAGLFSSALQYLVQMSRSIVFNVGFFFLSLALMIFCIYFFYLDGPYLARLLLHSIPIRKEHLSALSGKFLDIIRNLFFGYIIVALIQAALAFGIFLLFRIEGALVFAGITFFCVFVPIFGGSLVWFPIGAAMFLNGKTGEAVLFILVSMIFISGIDNFLRPWFLKTRIRLHPLIIFFAILGGISVFGFNGLVLGPLLVILFLTVLDLFLAELDIKEAE
jgi:predicted PurR-regulated permease PerM